MEFDLGDERRLPDNVAATVYFVVSETLANVAKHARASLVRVVFDPHDPVRVSVRDDGVGGAGLRPGAAPAGLKERVEALSGTFELESPGGGRYDGPRGPSRRGCPGRGLLTPPGRRPDQAACGRADGTA